MHGKRSHKNPSLVLKLFSQEIEKKPQRFPQRTKRVQNWDTEARRFQKKKKKAMQNHFLFFIEPKMVIFHILEPFWFFIMFISFSKLFWFFKEPSRVFLRGQLKNYFLRVYDYILLAKRTCSFCNTSTLFWYLLTIILILTLTRPNKDIIALVLVTNLRQPMAK